MSQFNQPTTFCQLLRKYARIEVPLIQRDYAQGRETEKDIRDDFLKALYGALSLPSGNPGLPLNLDFIYGSMEGANSSTFLPLDGQQRLTTLFLLHWYTAWHDGQSSEFESLLWDGKHARFTYAVRPSSTEFFDELVHYIPHCTPDEVSSVRKLVEDQSWFFLHWRLDPTIQSVLVMLDAIHGFFKTSTSLFNRLVDDEYPAITFELLPLEHFGLTDDLYIKMNARGKPLTPFETFKARFEELLTGLFPIEKRVLVGVEISVADFFERRIDTRWTDLFWAYKNPETHTFDEPFMNLFLALARVSLDPESAGFSQDTTRLRERQLAGTFSLFHEHGWLTRDFASNLIELLEVWSRGAGKLAPLLPSRKYFDEATFFEEAIQKPEALDYTRLLQFAAFVIFLRHHRGNGSPTSLNEWMRVVRNLAANTEIERPEEYRRALMGLQKLLPFSAEILERLSDTDIGQIGFSPQQVREEVLKAKLILADPAWRDRIDKAEEHHYFSGQIEFLLDFCGAEEKTPASWDEAEHSRLQTSFDGYFTKAQITFTPSGLAATNGHLWKRGLLAMGDYLSSTGSNYSFLTDPQRNWDSWKRFLRGRTRELLKALWDRIDENSDIEPQLEQLIAGAANVEPWRAAIIAYPQVISYCGQQEIRREGNIEEIYLLTKRQMTGYHAELFSYVLSLELGDAGVLHDLTPLRLQPYQSVYMREREPHLLLTFDRSMHRVNFLVESAKGQFRIYARCAELAQLPEVEAALCGEATFVKEGETLMRLVPRSDVHQLLRRVARSLAKLANPN